MLAGRSHTTLDQIASYIRHNGGEAIAVAADVGDRVQVEGIAAAAIAAYGRIDTWVNNAGVGLFGRLDETPDDDGHRLFETNFWGIVYGSLVALPYLKLQGGALINVGSEVSDAVAPLQGMYSASKHAVKGYTDSLRIELNADKAPVSVTLIQPTAVDTPFAEHAGNRLSQAPKLPTPMIEPEKVASAILKAATSPERDVRVGAMSVIDTMVSKILPSLGDAMGKMQIGRQQRNEPPTSTTGTLYTGGESGQTRGRGDQNAADRKAAEQSKPAHGLTGRAAVESSGAIQAVAARRWAPALAACTSDATTTLVASASKPV